MGNNLSKLCKPCVSPESAFLQPYREQIVSADVWACKGVRSPVVLQTSESAESAEAQDRDCVPYWGAFGWPAHLIIDCAQLKYPSRSVIVPITNAIAGECVRFVQLRRVQDCFDTKGCCDKHGTLVVSEKQFWKRKWVALGQASSFIQSQATMLLESSRSAESRESQEESSKPAESRESRETEARRCISETIQSLFVKRARGFRFVFLAATLSGIAHMVDVCRVLPDTSCHGDDRKPGIVIHRPSSGCCAICWEPTSRKCSVCRCVFYCGRVCQVSDWPFHKSECSHSVLLA